MIVISSKPGQLGNMLILYANLLAYSIEKNLTILNPAFYEYKSYFNYTNKGLNLFNSLMYKIAYLIARILIRFKINNQLIGAVEINWDERMDLDNQLLFKNKANKIFFVQGWQYRASKLITKHKEQIKMCFTPIPFYEKKINDFFIQNFNQLSEIIIGVHVRHGDYKSFEGGKYYYSFNQYNFFLNQLSSLFKNNKIHFLICSNNIEEAKLHLDSKSNKITFAPNHELMDMYCLSKCNYIVGPPSTYSIWASFYGTVPLFMIKSVNDSFLLTSFEIIQSF
jgi:hypothetical protein